MYMQADVKVGEDFGVKVGDDVIILNGTSVIPISIIEKWGKAIEDITFIDDPENNSAILSIKDDLWNEAQGLQNKLNEIKRVDAEVAAQGKLRTKKVEADVKIMGVLGYEAFPGIYIMDGGKIELKEALQSSALDIESCTGVFDAPTSLLNRAEDLYRTLNRRVEPTPEESSNID